MLLLSEISRSHYIPRHASNLHFFNHAGVLFVLIATDSNQQQIALIILQCSHIILLLDLLDGSVRVLILFQFNHRCVLVCMSWREIRQISAKSFPVGNSRMIILCSSAK